jgi:hypothetical protein
MRASTVGLTDLIDGAVVAGLLHEMEEIFMT